MSTQPAAFKINFRSNVSEVIAAVICAPIRLTDFSTFSSVDEALSHTTDVTRKRLNSTSSLVQCYGNEMTSRINSMKMQSVDETYDALAPLTCKSDNLTIQVISSRQGHVPLNKLSIDGARTLINLFVYTYIDTLMDMVKSYDDDNQLDKTLKSNPTDFWVTLSELLSCCAGYPEFDMTRI